MGDVSTTCVCWNPGASCICISKGLCDVGTTCVCWNPGACCIRISKGLGALVQHVFVGTQALAVFV